MEGIHTLLREGERIRASNPAAQVIPEAELLGDLANKTDGILDIYKSRYSNRLRTTESGLIASGIRNNISTLLILKEYFGDYNWNGENVQGAELVEKIRQIDQGAAGEFTAAERKVILEASRIVIVLERIVDQNANYHGKHLDAEGISNTTFNILQNRRWMRNPAESKNMNSEQLRTALLAYISSIENDALLKRTKI